MNISSNDLKDYFSSDEDDRGESMIDHYLNMQLIKMETTKGIDSIVDFLKTLEFLEVLLVPAKYRKVSIA